VFGVLSAAKGTPPGVLSEVAREFSPRIEVCSHTEVVLDLSGLARLFGDARTVAEQLRRTAADRGLRVRVALAGTRTAARLLVRHRAGLTIVEPGHEAAAVAPLPIALLGDLAANEDPITTFRRWGLRTLGELAALPSDDLAARLGSHEADWQRLARGEDSRPLVPAVPEERFEQALDLEWPIDELEPLSFVLGRLMEPLSAHLERRGRGAAVLHVRLDLIKTDGTTRGVHERSLQLPVPIRDARTLRTLALLDLESNPPPAAIDRVTVAVDPTPARIVQFSLLARPLPSPEQLSTLMARLHALMGETRCGSPAPVDSWEPGAFAMKPFMPGLGTREPGAGIRDSQWLGARHSGVRPRGWRFESQDAESGIPSAESRVTIALRRFRHPVAVRVHTTHGMPTSVSTLQRGLSGGAVESCAGPWRTSGGWWGGAIKEGIRDQGSGIGRKTRSENPQIPDPPSPIPARSPWDRDEWDVALANGPTYRLFRERHTGRWFIEGVVD
jgi:protein ImuB